MRVPEGETRRPEPDHPADAEEFNVSIAEVGDNDHWRKARIGFSVVGNDKPYINAKMDHILRFIDQLELAEVVRSRIEIASFSDLMEAGYGYRRRKV